MSEDEFWHIDQSSHKQHTTDLWQTNADGTELRYCQECAVLYTNIDKFE